MMCAAFHLPAGTSSNRSPAPARRRYCRQPQLVSGQSKNRWLRKCRGEFDLGLDYTYGVFSSDESEVIGGAALLNSGRMSRTITRRDEKCSVS